MTIGGCRHTVLVAALLMAGCAQESPVPAVSQASSRPPAFKVQTFQPEAPSPQVAPGLEGPATGTAERYNDPSAPIDTPLCGRAAQEANAAAVVLSPLVSSSGDACLANACFNALTDTYIGADGFRHVCQ